MQYRTNTQAIDLLKASVVANQVGDEFTRGEYLKHFLQVTGGATPVAVQLQVSGDAVTWFDHGPPVSSPGYLCVEGYFPWMRAKRDGTTNTVSVLLESGWSQPR